MNLSYSNRVVVLEVVPTLKIKKIAKYGKKIRMPNSVMEKLPAALLPHF